ncbi:hypothetical protein SAMN04244559_00879 [Magnetospirillum fulvum]|uniref:Uncharacterized protein n=1 Tax=Magnetospirillum fulvum TaxID=1082 RepID=A0A1H6H7E7_MAGFU|nr:hypothetical protein SAMN04244559_00879 [Magnetospirillum fulvum]
MIPSIKAMGVTGISKSQVSIGAILLKRNDEWAVQRVRDMTMEFVTPFGDDPITSLLPVAAA